MSLNFGFLLHSKLFTFKIGPEATPVTVHSKAIAALSEPVDRLVNGNFQEAQENIAHFPDLEPADFDRISEYAYTKQYTIPIPSTTRTKVSENESDITKICVPIATQQDLTGKFASKEWGTHKLARRRTRMGGLQMDDKRCGWVSSCLESDDPSDCDQPTFVWDNSLKPWKNDITQVLLGHARLYYFAHRYLATEFMNYILHELHKYLMSLCVYDVNRQAFVDLLEYAYSNEDIPEREIGDRDGLIDELRVLVLDFFILHRKGFEGFYPFRELFKRNGEISLDWHDRVCHSKAVVKEQRVTACDSDYSNYPLYEYNKKY